MSNIHSQKSNVRLVSRPTFAFVVSAATAVAVFATTLALDRNITSNHQSHIRTEAVQGLAAVRGAAEIAINRRMHLLFGLKSYVTLHPDMREDEFATLSALIIGETDGIRSVTSIKDNVINDVFPRQGNERAIGLELLEHPKQRAAAEHAIKTGRPWLAGPVKLVQGGEAFIHRSPVFVDNDIEHPSRYWGMVSLLIDKETLVSEIMSNVPAGLSVAIRNRPAAGDVGTMFLGQEQILEMEPIETEISLPTGSWRLYGVPDGGWPDTTPLAAGLRVVGGLFSILVGCLTFSMIRSNARTVKYALQLEVANAEAQSARESAERVSVELAHEATELNRYATKLEQARQSLAASNTALGRSNQELEQFAYVASHDLQEPLRKVSSFCELLKEEIGDNLSEDGDRYIEYVLDGANRMRVLIEDLLAFSRIDSDANECEDVQVAEAVRVAINRLTCSIEETESVVTHGELPTVRVHQQQLSQLFQNLIGNGIKYAGNDSPSVHIEAKAKADEWVFSVKDNGIGIAPQFHDRVFGIFKRLHRRDQFSGTGIGLAICQRIVNRWGGKIWIESEEGQGATFYFTIPFNEADASNSSLATESRQPAEHLVEAGG